MSGGRIEGSLCLEGKGQDRAERGATGDCAINKPVVKSHRMGGLFSGVDLAQGG